MDWHPYEISFYPSPRAKQRETWVRFASSAESALVGAKKAALEMSMARIFRPSSAPSRISAKNRRRLRSMVSIIARLFTRCTSQR